MNEIRKIVVGVDGSETSIEALRWAVREARAQHSSVTVVYAWASTYMDYIYGVAEDHKRFETAADEVLANALAELSADETQGVTINAASVNEHSAQAILDAAVDADLVVVGSRGRGTARAALLGSTSHALVQHAQCAVLVVKTPPTSAD